MAKKILPQWCKEAKKAMIDQDLDVTALSEKIGVSRSYVSGVLNNSVRAEEIAYKISEALGLKNIIY